MVLAGHRRNLSSLRSVMSPPPRTLKADPGTSCGAVPHKQAGWANSKFRFTTIPGAMSKSHPWKDPVHKIPYATAAKWLPPECKRRQRTTPSTKSERPVYHLTDKAI